MAERNTTPNIPRTLLTGNEAPPQPQSQYYTTPVPVVTVVPNQLEQVLFTLRALDSLGANMTKFARGVQYDNAMAEEKAKKNRIMLEGLGATQALPEMAMVDAWKKDWYGEEYSHLIPPPDLATKDYPAYYGSLTQSMVMAQTELEKPGSASIVFGFQEKLVPKMVDAAISLRTEQINANRQQKSAYFIAGIAQTPTLTPPYEEISKLFPGQNLTKLEYGAMITTAASVALNNGDNETAAVLLSQSAPYADPLVQSRAVEQLRIASIQKNKDIAVGTIAYLSKSDSLTLVDANAAGVKLAQATGFQFYATDRWNSKDSDAIISQIEKIALDPHIGLSQRLAFLAAFSSPTGYSYSVGEGDGFFTVDPQTKLVSTGQTYFKPALPADSEVMKRVSAYIVKLQSSIDNQHIEDRKLHAEGIDNMYADLANHIYSQSDAMTPEQITAWYDEAEKKNGITIPSSARQAAFVEKSASSERQEASIRIDVSEASTMPSLDIAIANATANYKAGYISADQFGQIHGYANNRKDTISIVDDFAATINAVRIAYAGDIVRQRTSNTTVFDPNKPDALLSAEESQGLADLTYKMTRGIMDYADSPNQANIRMNPLEIRKSTADFVNKTYNMAWWKSFIPTASNTSQTPSGLQP